MYNLKITNIFSIYDFIIPMTFLYNHAYAETVLTLKYVWSGKEFVLSKTGAV